VGASKAAPQLQQQRRSTAGVCLLTAGAAAVPAPWRRQVAQQLAELPQLQLRPQLVLLLLLLCLQC
jgi:hypothetical protein